MSSTKTLLAAVDLFCGVGGLTCGLRKAGVSVRAGYDLDPGCEYAYSSNNKVQFVQADVADLSSQDLASHLAGAEFTVLAGCAPCQPFSTYGRTRANADHRWKLLDAFSKHAIAIKPDVVTMENVPQVANHAAFKKFVRGLTKDGYTVNWNVVSSADFGVPQVRKRLILLASRHGELTLLPSHQKTRSTVRRAIEKLPPLKAGESSTKDPLHRACPLTALNIERIKASTPGGNWRDWDKSLLADCHKRSSGETYPSVYGRMEWDKPAPTITTQFFGYGNGRFGHPVQDRALSIREGAVLQTFPASYRFEKKGERVPTHRMGRLIGNAVPPLLAKHVGLSIVAHAQGVVGGAR